MYRLVQATYDACKSQLLEAFDEIYFRGLRNRHTGFTGISYLDMITHLYNNFGIITAVDIMENEKRMDAQYDPSITIESYFDNRNSGYTTGWEVATDSVEMLANDGGGR